MIGKAIVDSACLIALERTGQLELLPGLFNQIIIPPIIQVEFGQSLEWAAVQPVQNPIFVQILKTQIDDGEAEVIALALEQEDFYVVLDDKKARRIAKQIGLKLLGTIGVLLRAKRAGIIVEIKPVLDRLNEEGFYISVGLYQKALAIAGEG